MFCTQHPHMGCWIQNNLTMNDSITFDEAVKEVFVDHEDLFLDMREIAHQIPFEVRLQEFETFYRK